MPHHRLKCFISSVDWRILSLVHFYPSHDFPFSFRARSNAPDSWEATTTLVAFALSRKNRGSNTAFREKIVKKRRDVKTARCGRKRAEWNAGDVKDGRSRKIAKREIARAGDSRRLGLRVKGQQAATTAIATAAAAASSSKSNRKSGSLNNVDQTRDATEGGREVEGGSRVPRL